ncbi:MAG: hypothetical protein ACK57G_09730, partial [Planctomycetota bacterium]
VFHAIRMPKKPVFFDTQKVGGLGAGGNKKWRWNLGESHCNTSFFQRDFPESIFEDASDTRSFLVATGRAWM